MSLINEIKTRQLTARRRSDPEASLYTTLLGEALAIGKNAGNRETTDEEVVAIVKKFIKNIDETINALMMHGRDASVFLTERGVLETLLPRQLTVDELTDYAKKQVSMPAFMKFLKENFAGQYDGKLASTVAKTIFS